MCHGWLAQPCWFAEEMAVNRNNPAFEPYLVGLVDVLGQREDLKALKESF